MEYYSPWIRKEILSFVATWMDLDNIKDLEGNSVQFSHSVMSDSLWLHELQHTRLPCPSPSPRVCSTSCPSSRWCPPTISSSVTLFSSCLQPFPASGSFPVSHFFASGGQSIGASASASILPMNSQGWFPLGLTGLFSFLSRERQDTTKEHKYTIPIAL